MDYHKKYIKYKTKYLALVSKAGGATNNVLIVKNKNGNKIAREIIDSYLNSHFDYEWPLLGINYAYKNSAAANTAAVNTRANSSFIIYQKNHNKPFWIDSLAEELNSAGFNARAKYLNTIDNTYWFGPYDVLVPNKIESVVAADGYNTHYKNGKITEMGCPDCVQMNEKKYKSKYATYNKKDSKWYYKN